VACCQIENYEQNNAVIFTVIATETRMNNENSIKKRQFDEESDILKVLGHPIRLKIVAGLCSQECNVKRIWECLGLPQATVSQHLAVLKNKGIIVGKREGVEVHYRVVHPMAKEIINILA
jgi:ArsR family transcriptional regulator